jgi:hypothetical protein
VSRIATPSMAHPPRPMPRPDDLVPLIRHFLTRTQVCKLLGISKSTLQ